MEIDNSESFETMFHKVAESQAKTQNQLETLTTLISPLLVAAGAAGTHHQLAPNNSLQHILGEKKNKQQVNEDNSQQEIMEDSSSTVINPPNSTGSGEGNGSSNNKRNQGYYVQEYLPLHRATSLGDWEKARYLFLKDSNAITAPLTFSSQRPLHVAAVNGHTEFVEELVKLLPEKELEVKETNYGRTALHYAARAGAFEAVMIMVNKNPNLTQICDNQKHVPLLWAAMHKSEKQKEIVQYLWTVTRHEGDTNPYSGPRGADLICALIDAGFYDICSSVIQDFPKLVVEKNSSGECALEVLAQRPHIFPSGRHLKWWHHRICLLIEKMNDMVTPCHGGGSVRADEESLLGRSKHSSIRIKFLSYITRVPGINQVYEQNLECKAASFMLQNMCYKLHKAMSYEESVEFFKKSSILELAIKSTTYEVVEKCLRVFPNLVWRQTKGKTMIQIAIEERNISILKMIVTHKDGEKIVSRIDEGGNTILHYAAKLTTSPQLNSLSGAAIQMQREMQWFKGVESMIQEKEKLRRNVKGETAEFLFMESHKDLMEKGEEWMKGTSQSCLLVAALIATVTYTGAFSVPGGIVMGSTSEDNGTPIFLYKNSFAMFAISDALGLFSSITSVLLFFAILTSRYAKEDFLVSLPRKLIAGLTTLLLSFVFVMVAFGAALYILLQHRWPNVTIPIILGAFLPVALFLFQQIPFVFQMIRYTYYWPIIFRRQSQPSVNPPSKKAKRK